MVQAVEPTVTPAPGAKLWPMSVEAYHVLGEAGVIPKNTELLYGLVYSRMPISPFHAFLLGFLLDRVSKAAGSLYVRSEMPITCRDSEPQPDISVVHGTLRDFRHKHPHTAELVIEVCISSHEYDRSKLPAYAKAGVKEVWLVLGPEKQVEIYREPANAVFLKRTIHQVGEIITSASVPEFSISLAELFAD